MTDDINVSFTTSNPISVSLNSSQSINVTIEGGGLSGVSQTEFSNHTSNTSIHFTTGAISITTSQITDFPDLNNYALQTSLSNHTTDSSIHFTTGAISITTSQISDFPVMTDYALSTSLTNHTNDTSIHFTQSTISITTSQISDYSTYIETDPVFNSWLSTNPLSGYVPYTGANTSVNLGTNTLSSQGLVVDGGVLYVDSTNNRVGVNTLSPRNRLEALGSHGDGIQFRINSTSNNTSGFLGVRISSSTSTVNNGEFKVIRTNSPNSNDTQIEINQLKNNVVTNALTINSLGGITVTSTISASNLSGTNTGDQSFLTLGDTPTTYSGQSGKGVRVASGETSLEFYTVVDTDEKVKLSASDSTAGYLNAKLQEGIDAVLYKTTITSTSTSIGLMYWDSTNHTATLNLENNVKLQLGQEQHIYGKNISTSITISNGSAVSIVSSNGSFTAFGLADATNAQKAYAFVGLATQDILPEQFGYVTKAGVVRDLNTDSFVEGRPVYVDPATPGALTTIYPSAPNYIINAGIVEHKHLNQGRINVIPLIVPKLQDLSDVDGYPLSTTGQIPVWNQTSGYFDFDKNLNDYAPLTTLSAHTSDSTIHFTTGAISITTSQISDFPVLSNYALQTSLSNHTTNSSIHFTTGAISITTSQISDISGKYLVMEAITTSSHYSGFPNQDDTTLSFNNTTTSLTLNASSAPIWVSGTQYNINSLSTSIPNTTSINWFWITAPLGTPQLNTSPTAPGFDKCLVATVYWNPKINKYILANERHWMGRDRWNHEYLHQTVGARYSSGLTGTFTNTTINITQGEFYDEDLEHSIVEQTTCKVLYHNGTSDWEWDVLTTPYKVVNPGVNNTLYFNNGNNLATVDNNKYMNVWVFITGDEQEPVHVFIGTAQYATIALARAAGLPSFGSLGTAENKIIYKVTYQNIGGTPTYIETTDYRASSNLPSTSFVATDHGSLTGLSDDDHTQYAYLSGRDGGQIITGGDSTGEDLTLKDNATDSNTLTLTQIRAAVNSTTNFVSVGVTSITTLSQINSSLTGSVIKASSGTLSAATANVDYVSTNVTSLTSITQLTLKNGYPSLSSGVISTVTTIPVASGGTNVTDLALLTSLTGITQITLKNGYPSLASGVISTVTTIPVSAGGTNVTSLNLLTSLSGLTQISTGLTGVLKASTGTISAATAGTDYVVPAVTSLASLSQVNSSLTASVVKASSGTLSAATANTDYVSTNITSLISLTQLSSAKTGYVNLATGTISTVTTIPVAGGGTNVTSLNLLTSLSGLTQISTGLTGLLKASTGTVSAATAGTDYVVPSVTSLTSITQLTLKNGYPSLSSGVISTVTTIPVASGGTNVTDLALLTSLTGITQITLKNGYPSLSSGVISTVTTIPVASGGTNVTSLNLLTSLPGLTQISTALNGPLAATGGVVSVGPRVQNVTSAATITPDVTNYDCLDISSASQSFTIAVPTGTAVNFQKLMIRIKDNGTSQGISWGTTYAACGTSLATTTIAGKYMVNGFIYCTVGGLNKWHLVGVAQEA